MGHAGAPGGKRISTQNRVQPTTSDSSDQLFKIRKMRGVKVRFWCDFFFSAATRRQAYAPCTAQDRASVAGKWVRALEKGACFHATTLTFVTGEVVRWCSKTPVRVCFSRCVPSSEFRRASASLRIPKWLRSGTEASMGSRFRSSSSDAG